MLLRLIEDGKPEIFQQQIYDLLVIIARIDYHIATNVDMALLPDAVNKTT
jgi:hypothetical protein